MLKTNKKLREFMHQIYKICKKLYLKVSNYNTVNKFHQKIYLEEDQVEKSSTRWSTIEWKL